MGNLCLIPEVARVGLSEQDAEEQGIAYGNGFVNGPWWPRNRAIAESGGRQALWKSYRAREG